MESKSERISRLKALIEKTKQKIKLKSENLDKLSKDLSAKKQEISRAEDDLQKLTPPKILTRKEINQLKEEKAREEFTKRLKEKANIKTETEKAFQKAKKIKADASCKSKKEREEAEALASSIEAIALKRENKVLKEIIEEKSEVYDDLIAQIVCNDFKLRKVKFLENGKNEKSKLKAEIKNLSSLILKMEKEIIDVNRRFRKSSNKLKAYSSFQS